MKIVFIVNALHMQRCVKRIDEFAERGYKVEAYGFDRGVEVKRKPSSCEIAVIGKIDSATSYGKRLGTLNRGVRNVIKRTGKEQVVFYVFGLDNAMFFMFHSHRPFIYEESDLVYTYMKSGIARSFFEWVDKRAIKKSLLSVFTSEGFVKFHFGDKAPANIAVIANKLPPSVLGLKELKKKNIDINHLSIGFVGFIRFKSIFNFAQVFCERYPDSSFHFFGTANNEPDRLLFEPLHKYSNCYFHGVFKHPDDLPQVYSQLDIVLSTYDVENENVRYAEPNKIYEAIFFKTPIVVSSGTFLADKVNSLNIGYSINPLNDIEVIRFIDGLTTESLTEKKKAMEELPSSYPLNINDSFFSQLKQVLDGCENNS